MGRVHCSAAGGHSQHLSSVLTLLPEKFSLKHWMPTLQDREELLSVGVWPLVISGHFLSSLQLELADSLQIISENVFYSCTCAFINVDSQTDIFKASLCHDGRPSACTNLNPRKEERLTTNNACSDETLLPKATSISAFKL